MTTADEYRQVYEGICAVSARCDGAVTKDGVGFNGQDTKFGKRIASVPFEEWTLDVCQEAARISLVYRQQIETYTGVDVAKLDVVRDAQDDGTNYVARDLARTFEKRAAKAALADERRVDFNGTNFTFSWVKGDPDFGALLTSVKALPGRTFDWNTKLNVVPRSEALETFIQTWDFPLTDRARAELSKPWQAPVFFHITLLDDGRVKIDTPYEPSLVEAIKHLPGREYRGGGINFAAATPAIKALAREFNLKVHEDALAACEASVKAAAASRAKAAAEGDRRALMAQVSRMGKPEQLPENFIQRLNEVLGK